MQNQNTSDLVQCPYEKSHLILPSRFQVHLGRCRRNHKNQPTVVCPFNVTHVLNEVELNHHVTVCPERASFDQFKNKEPIATESAQATISQSKFALPAHTGNDFSECWDDDPPAPTYDPQVYASNAKILRNIQGVPPSERKEFRKNERKRLLGIKN